MGLNAITFRYEFTPTESNDPPIRFELVLDGETLEAVRADSGNGPDWTRAEFERCTCCPLPEMARSCPAAAAMAELVESCGKLLSYVRVEAVVETNERTVRTTTTAQRALSSVLGLYMATSGCPVLARFKPMARFHLPFSSREETIFRSAGAYLLAQYFTRKRGGVPDLDLSGLKALYEQVHEVNRGMAARMRNAYPGDAGVNAIGVLDLYAQFLPMAIDEELIELEPLFSAFSTESPATAP